MNAFRTATCFAIIFMAVSLVSGKEWRGLVPLKSNRADVERLLGPSDSKDFATYYLPDETVHVWYSNHGCHEQDRADRWNVVPGTVIGISVAPKKIIRLADLSLNLRRFKKENGATDLPGDVFYADDERGFSVEVLDGIVRSLNYQPTRADKYLQCRHRKLYKTAGT